MVLNTYVFQYTIQPDPMKVVAMEWQNLYSTVLQVYCSKLSCQFEIHSIGKQCNQPHLYFDVRVKQNLFISAHTACASQKSAAYQFLPPSGQREVKRLSELFLRHFSDILRFQKIFSNEIYKGLTFQVIILVFQLEVVLGQYLERRCLGVDSILVSDEITALTILL